MSRIMKRVRAAFPTVLPNASYSFYNFRISDIQTF